jgi:uncharacterized membrane protein (DUF373 family)
MVKDEDRPHMHINDYLGKAELIIYSILAVLLFVTALAALASAGKLLWDGLSRWTIATETLRVLDQLLLVLMLVEILHTVRISISAHLHPLAYFGYYRTIPCRGPDCLDSTYPRD